MICLVSHETGFYERVSRNTIPSKRERSILLCMRYLSSTLSRLSLFAPVDSPATPVTPRTPQSSHSNPGAPSLVRGLILSTSPYLKGTAADPKVSLTPVTAADSSISAGSSFDVSLISDTSTSSSCSDDNLVTPLHSLDINDLFSPRRHTPSLPITPSPPHLVGLGISGVPRRDGKPGDFDGLGLVRVRRSFNPRNSFLMSGEDDDDDDGYSSPTPLRVHTRGKRDQEQGNELSETFMRELVFTWESDPQHTRVLSTITECDGEDELEFQQTMLQKEVNTEPTSRPELGSPSPSSSPSSFKSFLTASTSSPLTLRTDTRTRAPQTLKSHEQPNVLARPSSQNSYPSHTRSKSSSTVTPPRGRTTTRSRKPSALRSGQDDGAVRAPSKQKLAIKGVWRT